MQDKQKETEFYLKEFKFSYSSLNRLLFSPSLFYKDYILLDKEERIGKHLIEGSLIHCLLFEPNSLLKKFKIVPDKAPSDSIRKILYKLNEVINGNQDLLSNTKAWTNVILQVLIEQNLYQSLKKDEARLAKIQTNANVSYWKFISNLLIDVVDSDTLKKCKEQTEILLQNDTVKDLLIKKETDFALDPIQTFTEKKLECTLNNYKFGLKGVIDHYQIDSNAKQIIISDLKTTSKSITDFAETIDFYNYWLQATVYCKLVYENHKQDCDNFKILFKFIVIDKYKQVYVFDVSDKTLSTWANSFTDTLNQADYHYTNNDYSLPYDFLVNKITL